MKVLQVLPALEQGGEQSQPLMLPLSGGGPGMKLKVPAGKDRDLGAQEGGQISGHTPGLSVVSADHNHRAAGLLPEGGGQMGPVDGGQAGERQGALPLFQGLQKLKAGPFLSATASV